MGELVKPNYQKMMTSTSRTGLCLPSRAHEFAREMASGWENKPG